MKQKQISDGLDYISPQRAIMALKVRVNILIRLSVKILKDIQHRSERLSNSVCPQRWFLRRARATLIISLAIPVSVQMSLALTWIYFSIDSFYFQPANIHFIPEVTHRG